MAELCIDQPHALGLVGARALAQRWLAQAQCDWRLTCVYEAGVESDVVRFHRPGVEGELVVGADAFALRMRLGFLLRAFQDRVERELRTNLCNALAAAQGADAAPGA